MRKNVGRTLPILRWKTLLTTFRKMNLLHKRKLMKLEPSLQDKNSVSQLLVSDSWIEPEQQALPVLLETAPSQIVTTSSGIPEISQQTVDSASSGDYQFPLLELADLEGVYAQFQRTSQSSAVQ